MRISDWSSDVCSSDLRSNAVGIREQIEQLTRQAASEDQAAADTDAEITRREQALADLPDLEKETDTDAIREQPRDAETAHATADRQRRRVQLERAPAEAEARSEERRVGKECVRACRTRG